MIINIKTLLLTYIKYISRILLLLIFLRCESDECVLPPTINISGPGLAGESPSYVAFVEPKGDSILISIDISDNATGWKISDQSGNIYSGMGDDFFLLKIDSFVRDTNSIERLNITKRTLMFIFETMGSTETEDRVVLTTIQQRNESGTIIFAYDNHTYNSWDNNYDVTTLTYYVDGENVGTKSLVLPDEYSVSSYCSDEHREFMIVQKYLGDARRRFYTCRVEDQKGMIRWQEEVEFEVNACRTHEMINQSGANIF